MSNNELTEMLLSREITIRFVSVQDAVCMHDESIARVGGTAGARDLSLLEHVPSTRSPRGGRR